MRSVSFDVLTLWSCPTGSIGVFLGLEVEPPQHLGLFRPVKGCQMSMPQLHLFVNYTGESVFQSHRSVFYLPQKEKEKKTRVWKCNWWEICARWHILRYKRIKIEHFCRVDSEKQCFFFYRLDENITWDKILMIHAPLIKPASHSSGMKLDIFHLMSVLKVHSCHPLAGNDCDDTVL